MANRLMFLAHRAVPDRHVVAGEIHQTRPQLLMEAVQGSHPQFFMVPAPCN